MSLNLKSDKFDSSRIRHFPCTFFLMDPFYIFYVPSNKDLNIFKILKVFIVMIERKILPHLLLTLAL